MFPAGAQRDAFGSVCDLRAMIFPGFAFWGNIFFLILLGRHWLEFPPVPRI